MNTILSSLSEREVTIPCNGTELIGDLAIPAGAHGLVIFAHGSGSSRLSPRNCLVALEMHSKGLATLLFDLLTHEEAAHETRSGGLRFNIPLLAKRLEEVTRWAQREESLQHLAIGYFGASTGAAAALVAAAEIDEIQAVVSRGGRTDLAAEAAPKVKAATLLIAGDNDFPVIEWNRETLQLLPGVKHLSLIHGASHLFEEPHALEEAAALAASWLGHYLPKFETED